MNSFGTCGTGYVCLRPYEATTTAQVIGHCCRAQPRCTNAPYLTSLKVYCTLILNAPTKLSILNRCFQVCSQFIGFTNECDLGYVCETSSIPAISVCCPVNDRGYCPTGRLPQINAFTNTVQQCQPTLQAAECIRGFSLAYKNNLFNL